MAATSFHLVTRRWPISGSRPTQSGGGGTDQVASCCTPPAMSSEYEMIVVRAKVSGTSRPSSNTTVITATASPRRPHSTDCARTSSGHVATTIMIAQTTAGRNGRKIQKLATIMPPMNSTPSVTRARSRETYVSITVLSLTIRSSELVPWWVEREKIRRYRRFATLDLGPTYEWSASVAWDVGPIASVPRGG